MAIENEFGFIGWCKEGTSDKIWGYFYRPTDVSNNRYITKHHGWNVCVFWGRRGKAMQFKPDHSGYDLEKLVREKQNKKNYVPISQGKLFEIWPTFIQEAEGKLMWEVLAGRIA